MEIALALVRNLPHESATAAAMQGGPEYRGWGVQQYMLATVIDLLQNHNYAFIMANRGKGPAPKEPVKYPRPGDRKKATNPFRTKLEAMKRNRKRKRS